VAILLDVPKNYINKLEKIGIVARDGKCIKISVVKPVSKEHSEDASAEEEIMLQLFLKNYHMMRLFVWIGINDCNSL
jgi:hypothetical protein